MELKNLSYYERPEISHSDLSNFEWGGPNYFRRCKQENFSDKDTEAFSFGEQFHCFVLEPEKFDAQYAVEDVKRVNGLTGEFLKNIVKLEKEPSIVLEANEIYKTAYLATGFKLSFENVLKSLEQGENIEYLNFLRENWDKIRVSKESYSKIQTMYENLMSHKKARKLILEEGTSSEDCEVFFEKEIYWESLVSINKKAEELEMLACKSKLDILIIDKTNKKVTIADLKTTGKSLRQFKESYKDYKYYRQLAYYKDAAAFYLAFMGIKDVEKWKFQIYIIAVEKGLSNDVAVFEPAETDLIQGAKEYKSLQKELMWHFKNNIWTPKSSSTTTGVEPITIFDTLNINDSTLPKEQNIRYEQNGENGREIL